MNTNTTHPAHYPVIGTCVTVDYTDTRGEVGTFTGATVIDDRYPHSALGLRLADGVNTVRIPWDSVCRINGRVVHAWSEDVPESPVAVARKALNIKPLRATHTEATLRQNCCPGEVFKGADLAECRAKHDEYHGRMLRILQSSHMTATVDTQSGSRYTVVTRNGRVTVIHDDSNGVWQGTDLHILGGRFYLRDNDDDNTLIVSTPITSVYILSN